MGENSLPSNVLQVHLHAVDTPLQLLNQASLGWIFGAGQHLWRLLVPEHLYSDQCVQIRATLPRSSLHPWRWIFCRNSSSGRVPWRIFTFAWSYSGLHSISAWKFWVLHDRRFNGGRKLWNVRSSWSVEMDSREYWKLRRRSYAGDTVRRERRRG